MRHDARAGPDATSTIDGNSVVGTALDDDRTMVMPVAGRTCDDHGIAAAVMAMTPAALAIVMEGDGAVMAVVETVAFVVDDDGRTVMIMMPVMRADDDISLGRGSDGGSGDTKRQGSDKHCFHCSIPDF
ncbi:MAG: hypothetical protein J0H31_10980 [Alphaproteobacteria bacterium]|nr:hypothetical protein [Alphaproteobacteria bacterium]